VSVLVVGTSVFLMFSQINLRHRREDESNKGVKGLPYENKS
jgi:hypothetical protein